MKKMISLFLCLTMCICAVPLSISAAPRDTSYEEMLAQDLKELGLFQGVSDTDFALDREPTRVEALVMLIRFLGKDSVATKGNHTHPFTDVPGWANCYVGYAYEQGLTNGISDTTFGTGTANAQMYLTFMLRALGYSDANGVDFLWNNPYTLAESVGILPSCVNRTHFLRADVVLVSYAALAVNMKNSTKTLAQKLISDGVFTYNQYKKSYDVDAIKNYTSGPVELSAEQVYDKCSPAVFYLEVYNADGRAIASGSGFFIDSNGTAVTNYHVIEGTYTAKAKIADSDAEYDVLGVYDYNKEQDWAVIKVKGSGFPYLEIGDKATVVGGATVYAIGSPLGLQNTISQGLISNPSRTLEGVTFIQTSAAISQGSSGGALINKYGQVIGITSAGFVDGENLGLALPTSVFEGYKRTEITTLKDLAMQTSKPSTNVPSGTGNATRREKALSLLRSFIKQKQNTEFTDGAIGYSESIDTEHGYVEAILALNTDNSIQVLIWEEYDKDLYYFALDISEMSNERLVYYEYESYYSNKFRAISFIDAAKYTVNTTIKFSNYEGSSKNLTIHESICGEYLTLGLGFTNGVFQEYLAGDYSVKDLGFTSFQ